MVLLDKTIKFLKFINKFRDVERSIYATGLDRMENDVEHSYQLAVTVWFLITSENLDLDLEKSIKYSLVHDLVETFAGDTPFMHSSHSSKRERESKALNKIKKLFGRDFEEMHKLIELYEERKDKESKFVNAVDKLLPMLNAYMDGGRSWRGIYPDLDVKKAIEIKKEAATQHPLTAKLFDEWLKIVMANQKKYFG